MPADWTPPSEKKKKPQITYNTQSFDPYPSETPTYTQYSREVSNIIDVIALLEELRLKHKKRALTTSLSNSLKHWQAQADDDLNVVDAYISMCKGAFEKGKEHFEDAKGFLDHGRAAIPSSHYALTLLCQAYLASDDQEESRKIQAAKKASETMQEELAKAIFDLIIFERRSDSASIRSIGNKIRDLVEEEMESSEMRYNIVFDPVEIARRRAEYHSMLERAMDRRERAKHEFYRSLEGR